MDCVSLVLKRVYPEEFGRKDPMDLRHEGQVEVNKPVNEEEQKADECFKQLESEMNEN